MRPIRNTQPGLHSIILTRLLALTVAAVLAVFLIGAKTLGGQLREDAAEHLRESALRVAEGLESYLQLHQSAVALLTQRVELGSDEELAALLKTYPGFLSVLVTDAEGRILSAALRDGEKIILSEGRGHSVADREYYQGPRRDGRPYLSGVFQGRGLGAAAIVAVSAPRRDGAGRFAGVVEGSIDITRLPLSPDLRNTMPMVVAQDGQERVVYSTHPELQRPMSIWEPHPMEGGMGAMPFLLADPGITDGQGQPVPLYAIRFPLHGGGWQVTAAMPMAEIEAQAYKFYRQAAVILGLVVLAGWGLARMLASNVASPIRAMAEAMNRYEIEDAPEIRAPRGLQAREIGQIQAAFVRMGNRLRESHRAKQKALEELDRKVVERTGQLAASERRYRQVVENSGDVIYRTDALGRITFHNAAFVRLLGGKDGEDWTGRQILRSIDEGCREHVRRESQRQVREGLDTIYLEYRITRADGQRRWIGQSTQLLRAIDGGRFPKGFQAIGRDITEQKVAELALREAEERFALAVRGSNNGIWDWDLRTGRVYYSPRWREMFGLSGEDLGETIESWLGRVHREDVGELRSMLTGFVECGPELFESEHRIRHADGTWRWVTVCGAAVRDGRGKALRVAGSVNDVTAGKLVDALTGLPNRLAVLETLENWLGRLRENESRTFGVLFLDLDRFKLVNDSLGHAKGDHLLLGVAMRLSGALDSMGAAGGMVGRLGGDEFVVLIELGRNEEAAQELAQRVLGFLEPSFHLDGSMVFVSASIGITECRSGTATPESLLRDADTAMYHAKAGGRGRCATFDRSMHARAVARLEIEMDLRRAVENGEFELYYQAQADLRTGRLIGFEALVRWRHPVRGLLQPDEFIGLAEENGLILSIGKWVLREGCRQLTDWARANPCCEELSMSINLSARQFTDRSLARQVQEILEEFALAPERLHLEVTESMLAEDPELAQSILRELSGLGVKLEVDDFGTGYSSLSQLNRLPFQTLKIDRTFVQAMDKDPEGKTLIDSIASLAEGLGIDIVAEGIESQAHWQYLSSLGCQYGQGYFLSEPVEATAALALAQHRHQQPWPVPETATDLLQLAELTGKQVVLTPEAP
jgi:diguanylate cyclase (GGDEF)-like protein/PAS domain S-box-containing protein